MKMKKLMKRMLSCILAVAMCLGLLTGCGNDNKETTKGSEQGKETTQAGEDGGTTEEAKKTVTYPLDTDVTLKIALIPVAGVVTAFGSMAESPFFQQLQERTGVKIEIVEVADKAALELMLMSGEGPDMVWGTKDVLPGGAQICVEDGIILSLNDYLDEYMPDYKALLEEVEEYSKIVTTDSGDVWGATQVAESYAQTQYTGIAVRQDWLNDLGMESPRTAEQFYDMLVAFKEKKGAEVPLSTTFANIKNHFLMYGISDAFGLVSAGFYRIDDTVHYGYAEAEVKEVFAFLKKLYDEGLLDPEFATLDAATEKSNILTGRSGCLRLNTGSVDSYRKAQENENYWLCGISPLAQTEDGVARGGVGTGLDKNGAYVITGNCKNPEIAAAFMNYGYSEEGQLFYNFGEEEVCWNYDSEGQPTFTDLIMKNPDGLSYTVACSAYAHGNSVGPFVQMERYYQQALSVDEHRVLTFEKYSVTDWENYCISGGVQIAADDADEYAKIKSEVETYIDQMIVAYITGAKSLDGFETEYLATLKSLKVDRMIEIYQAAYDAYVE